MQTHQKRVERIIAGAQAKDLIEPAPSSDYY